MRQVIAAVLGFLAFQGVLPQQRPAALTGSIEGLVLRADTAEPIANAQVSMTRVVTPAVPGVTPSPAPAPLPQIVPVTTDAAGKFAFTDLEPGSYRIVVARNGFVRENYGARFSGGPGTAINVSPGQTMKDIAFRLVATAVVSGRVRDSSGAPGQGMGVQLLKSTYNTLGQRTLQIVVVGRTDDRGEYRLFWITPGRYSLAVGADTGLMNRISISSEGVLESFANSGPNGGSMTGQPNVYYPGTLDPSLATSFDVGPGGELSSVDVRLPRTQLHRLRGRIVDSSTGQPPRSASINLILRDTSIPTLGVSVNPNYDALTGTFELRDVVPGSYWLRAQSAGSPATIPLSASGERLLTDALASINRGRMAVQVPVDVAADIEGMVLSLIPGFAVPGSLRVEGQPLPTVLFVPRVTLRPTSPSGLGSGTPPMNADGTFTLVDIMPGEYRVQVLPMPQDYYIKEARLEQADVLNRPLAITGPTRGRLEVVISSGAAQIEGKVLDARSQPVSAIQAVLIPDQYRDRNELFKVAVTDQDGKFTLRGITPGSYKLFAWENIEANAFYDPEVLRTYEQQGKAVMAAEGSKITTEVKMIPAKR